MTALWACVWRGGSFQHPFQFFHAHGDFLFQRGEVLQNFAWRAVGDFFVDDFLVAVEREVVALRGDLGFGHAETLRGARAVELADVGPALTPALSRKRARA